MSDPATLEAQTRTTPTAATPSLADLILLRLLVAKQGKGVKELQGDLGPLCRHLPSLEKISQVVSSMKAQQFLDPSKKGQELSAVGRARAFQILGVESLPPKLDWRGIKSKFLLPKAVGLSSGAKALTDRKQLAAVLLKRKLGLPVGTGNTLNAVCEAIACRELGFPEAVSLRALVGPVLGKLLGGTSLSREEAEEVVPRVLLGAKRKGIDGLRAVVLEGWIDEGATSGAAEVEVSLDPDESNGHPRPHPDSEEPFDLEAFANTVMSEARKSSTGRFGEDKVFINHVWQHLREEPRFKELGSEGFKQKLVEANQRRLLNLVAADMNQAFDANEISASRTTQGNATYNFILLGGVS